MDALESPRVQEALPAAEDTHAARRAELLANIPRAGNHADRQMAGDGGLVTTSVRVVQGTLATLPFKFRRGI